MDGWNLGVQKSDGLQVSCRKREKRKEAGSGQNREFWRRHPVRSVRSSVFYPQTALRAPSDGAFVCLVVFTAKNIADFSNGGVSVRGQNVSPVTWNPRCRTDPNQNFLLVSRTPHIFVHLSTLSGSGPIKFGVRPEPRILQ